MKRDLPVTQCLDAVHPSGQPINHSTHTGLNLPPAGMAPMSGSVSWPRLCPPLALPFQSFEDGVGKARALTASISVPPSRLLRGVTRPPFVAKELVGVGHMLNFAIAPSVGLNAAPSLADLLNRLPASTVHGVGYSFTYPPSVVVDFGLSYCPAICALSCVVGGGTFCKTEPTLAQVRSANIGSGYNRPARVIPKRGKLSDDSSGVSVRNDAWHVFQESESGL